MALSRSLSQKSRSASDGQRNLVNVADSEQLKVFKSKLAQISPVQPGQDLTGFQGHGFTEMLPSRATAVVFYLVFNKMHWLQ